jgi:hypothetical protein
VCVCVSVSRCVCVCVCVCARACTRVRVRVEGGREHLFDLALTSFLFTLSRSKFCEALAWSTLSPAPYSEFRGFRV